MKNSTLCGLNNYDSHFSSESSSESDSLSFLHNSCNFSANFLVRKPVWTAWAIAPAYQRRIRGPEVAVLIPSYSRAIGVHVADLKIAFTVTCQVPRSLAIVDKVRLRSFVNWMEFWDSFTLSCKARCLAKRLWISSKSGGFPGIHGKDHGHKRQWNPEERQYSMHSHGYSKTSSLKLNK